MNRQKTTMRGITIIIGIVLLLNLFMTLPSVSAACSIGASPLEMSANAKPGQTVEVVWNIFNLRGDRPTHVLVSQSSGEDWEIEFSPKATNKSYEVSGIKTISYENFAVETSEVVKTKPSGVYVVHPNSSEGFIKIENQIKISITLPENAKIGEKETFVFTALGKCFGETGAVSASLATELKVHITPSLDYYEKEVDNKNIFSGLFNARMENPMLMIAIGSTILLIIILLILIMLMLRRKAKKAGKTRRRK